MMVHLFQLVINAIINVVLAMLVLNFPVFYVMP
jgi:hypothetical protein